MTHRIINVEPLENFVISVTFQNGMEKLYDISKLFRRYPQFMQLERDYDLFNQVKVDAGGYGISWNDEIDLEAEEIWDKGTLTPYIREVDIKHYVGYQLTSAREVAGITQKELSEKAHMYQADISKIERGIANPSIQTLQKLAEGMGMKLRIEFVE